MLVVNFVCSWTWVSVFKYCRKAISTEKNIPLKSTRRGSSKYQSLSSISLVRQCWEIPHFSQNQPKSSKQDDNEQTKTIFKRFVANFDDSVKSIFFQNSLLSANNILQMILRIHLSRKYMWSHFRVLRGREAYSRIVEEWNRRKSVNRWKVRIESLDSIYRDLPLGCLTKIRKNGIIRIFAQSAKIGQINNNEQIQTTCTTIMSRFWFFFKIVFSFFNKNRYLVPFTYCR